MEWFTVSNANQCTLDGVVDSFKCQRIYIGWSGSQVKMLTNLHCIEWLTVGTAKQSTLD